MGILAVSRDVTKPCIFWQGIQSMYELFELTDLLS